MDRKRLISILSGMTLSLAAFSGPAIAIDTSVSTSDTTETTTTVTETVESTTEPTELTSGTTLTEPVDGTTQTVEDEADALPAPEETVTAEVPGVGTVTVDDEVTVETDLGTATVDPSDTEEPVKIEPAGDDEPTAQPSGSEDPFAAIGDLADADPLGAEAADDGDTTPAPRPTRQQREDAGSDSSTVALGSGARHHFAFARQAPAATDVESGDTLSPEVAAPRAIADDTELTAAPITGLDEVPMGLKIVASLLLAGAATTWWTVREALQH